MNTHSQQQPPRPSYRRFFAVFLGLAGLSLTSCATTDDPMTDSLFFSPEQANRRLSVKHQDLSNLRQQTESERIRSVTYRRNIEAEKQAQVSQQYTIASVKTKIAAAEVRLAEAENAAAAAERQGREDREALRKRNLEQAEVDRLTAILHRLLQTE